MAKEYIHYDFLNSMHLKKLRGVKNCYISFKEHCVTGIFGINGSGKSTILQAATSIYKTDNGTNTKMSRFFKDTQDSMRWIGSEYSATTSVYSDATKKREEKSKQYGKHGKIDTKRNSGWYPRETSKWKRPVIYIPLSDCTPDIDKPNQWRATCYLGNDKDVKNAEEILQVANYVLQSQYTALKKVKTNNIIGLRVEKNKKKCHSFNLGAGEQRVFRILEMIFQATQYSLILIEELDLTIHTAALKRLVSKMAEIARDRQLQIIFTSHRQELMKMNDIINVRFLAKGPEGTICLDNPDEDCYYALSGEMTKQHHIYVEDDIAKAIVKKVLQKCGIAHKSEIYRYGSDSNTYRLALALTCQLTDMQDPPKVLICTDGDNDNYIEVSAIEKGLNSAIGGGNEELFNTREHIKEMLCHFDSIKIDSKWLHPEQYIKMSIDELQEDTCQNPELWRVSKEYVDSADHHDYIKELQNRNFSLDDIIGLFAENTDKWNAYTKTLVEKIQLIK